MIISCSDSKEISNLSQNTVIGRAIDIELKSNEGINLLGTPEYPIGDIAATYLVNGEIAQSNNPHDYPNNVLFFNNNQVIKIYLNYSATEEFPITYIKWNKTETDTIKAQYKRTTNSITLDKLWILENNTWKELTSKPIIIIK